METKNQDRISELVEKQKDTYTSMADEIWGYAEPRFQEYESSRVQQEYLASRGFSIRADLAGEKTAFIAEWGSGKPVLAFLGEFDALSSLQQEADCTERRPIAGKTDGHGCGHHLLGTASVAAVDALKSYMEEKDLKGTIRYYGCPAEENAGGKAYLVRDGYFNDCDIAITWHPSTTNKTMGDDKFLANFRVFFTFHGISSHAAGAPELGRSALDAVEIMDIGVNYMREHMIDAARVHGAITNTGGIAPNVIPAEAQILYAIRAPKVTQVKKLYERMCDIAKGAALITGTTVDIRQVAAYSNVIGNDVLEEVMVGKNFNDYSVDSIRENISLVPQDPVLFMGDVRSNIRLDKDFTDEEVEKALRDIGADRLIDFRNGLDEEVKDNGASFSAGEKQLIAFARSYITNPKILILDEATANIDTQTESVIQYAIDKLKQNRTTFIIAHRLSTIKNVDCIYVLDKGVIVEKGTHEELLANGKIYTRMYREQNKKG